MTYEIHCAEVWGGISAKEDAISTPGVVAAIHSTPGGGAKGGDIYYFSVCAYDRLTRVLIADVRGHGEQVSHLSGWIYQALEARMNDANGARVLTDVNEIVRSRGFEAITTAAVATFDRDRGILRYAYAGHPPLFLCRGGIAWEPLNEGGGPPLGVLPGAKYSQGELRVSSGDRLFLYTDGVTECPGEGEEQFGDRELAAALSQSSGRPLDEAHRTLHSELQRFGGCSLDHDDVTFLTVEFLEPPPFWKKKILPGKSRSARLSISH